MTRYEPGCYCPDEDTHTGCQDEDTDYSVFDTCVSPDGTPSLGCEEECDAETCPSSCFLFNEQDPEECADCCSGLIGDNWIDDYEDWCGVTKPDPEAK